MKNIAKHLLLLGAALCVLLPTYAQEAAVVAEGAPPEATQETAADTTADASSAESAEANVSDVATAEAATEPPAEKAEPESANRLVGEIVVTAQKREERLQEVPLAVSAFSAGKLEALGIKSTEELPQITPGLVLSNKAGYTIIFLRGVGTDAFLPAADPNVPVYIDGIPQLTNQGISNVLGRISRVEVLKGPQGTLFGRNSTGGAVSLVTPNPSDTFEGDVGVEASNYGVFNTNFYLNVPIFDGLAAALSGYDNSQDSFYECVSCPVIDTFSRGVRLKTVWEATDDLSFNFGATYGETSNPLALLTKLQRPAPVLAGPPNPFDPNSQGIFLPKDETPGSRRVRQNQPGGVVSNNYVISAGLKWELPFIQTKVLASDQYIINPFAQWDFDSTDRALVSFRIDDQFAEQQTLELQFLSNDGTPLADYFSFATGFFYLKGDGGFPNLVLQVGGEDGFAGTGGAIFLGDSNVFDGFVTGLNGALAAAGQDPITGLSGPATLTSGGIIESESKSAYFQGTLDLQSTFGFADPANLVLGIRYGKETRGLRGARLGVLPPGVTDPHDNRSSGETVLMRFPVPNVSDNQMPLRASLNWFPGGGDTQLYTAWARGFTAPTYNPVNFFTTPDSLKPQKTDSFEIGIKSELLDGALTFNSAAFYIKQKDVLTGFLSVTSGGIVRFDNAPGARIYGIEFETTWQPMPESNPGLAVTGSATYLDGQYTDYPNGRGFDVDTGLSFGEGAVLPARDFKGNTITNTPDVTFNLGVVQAFDFNERNDMEVGIDGYYNSGFYNVPQEEKLYRTDAYHVLNARVSYFYRPWSTEITGFVKNFLDEEYNQALFVSDFGVQNTLAPPRMYGVRLKVTF